MTMDKTILIILFFIAVEAEIGKHTYIKKKEKWTQAQAYCRKHYSELSFVGSQMDQDKLINAAGENTPDGWIGLHREPDKSNQWKWSGGGDLTYDNWLTGKPDNYKGVENGVGLRHDGKWDDDCMKHCKHFYCIKITVVKIRKSWEEALEHCRETKTELPSLISKLERVQAQNVIQPDEFTDPVWIGLRYLNDRWLWINNDSLTFKDWTQGEAQDQQCPVYKRCGALTKTAAWEKWDCQEKLNFICVWEIHNIISGK